MVWANSILLGLGGLAIGVPILLHLLMQPKPKPLLFPALRFVQKNQRTNQRKMQLRHWILLALRILLLLILAAALAGPSTASNRFGAWVTTSLFGAMALIVAALLLISLFASQSKSRIVPAVLGVILAALLGFSGYSLVLSLQGNDGPVIGDQRAPVAAVIVVDTSPRMNYQYQNESSLSRAREMATWLVEQFPPDSQVAIVPTDGDDPFYSVDLESAKKRVSTLETIYLPQPLNKKVEACYKFLSDSELARRELYVLTDLTRKSWGNDENNPVSDVIAENRETSLYVVDVGPETYTNFAIDQLRLAQSTITKRDTLTVKCRVTYQSTADDVGTANRNLRMKLEKIDPVRRDGKTLVPDQFYPDRDSNTSVNANSASIVQFELGSIEEGVHHGTIQLVGEDGLAVDDLVHFSVEVKPAWPVLIVRPEDVSEYFLQDVLAASKTAYAPKIIDQTQMGNEDLSQYRAVFMLDPMPPSDTSWNQISQYVDNGGSLALFLGPNAQDNAGANQQFKTEAALTVMPALLSEIWRDVFLSPDSLSHPIMAAFRQNVSSIPWPKFGIFYYWGVRQIPNDDGASTEVVLRFSDGNPALIERRVGRGRVIMLTTPISESRRVGERVDWNVLTRNNLPGFLLTRMIGEYLVSLVRGEVNYEIGQTALLPNDTRIYPEQYRLYSPRNEEPGQVFSNDELLRYRFTDTPGHYRLKAAQGGVVLRGFSARLPDRLTDLSRFDEAELDELLGKGQYSLARDQFEVQREQGAMRIGREFYPLLVILLVIIFVVEWVFSNLFYGNRSRN